MSMRSFSCTCAILKIGRASGPETSVSEVAVPGGACDCRGRENGREAEQMAMGEERGAKEGRIPLEDAAEEGRMLETFLVDSWLEHLRQHERVTNADRVVQAAVYRFHMEGTPKVTHLIASEPDDG